MISHSDEPNSGAVTLAQRDEIRRLYLAVAPYLTMSQRDRCKEALEGTEEVADKAIEWMTDKLNSLAAAGA